MKGNKRLSISEQLQNNKDLERLQALRYIDDDFMTVCLEDNFEAVELILRIILNQDDIMPVVMACLSMGKQKVGALIVIEHNVPLDEIVRTGEMIDAAINQRLIENIFFKNSPLHDGAMVISKKRIKAAGCILPVSHDLNIPKELGLRHRAAMGISQQSDAHAIIVSEETGAISVAYRGQFYLRLNAEELESMLTKEN